MTTTVRQGVSWAGIVAGPAAWAVSFQLNYTLVPWQCANGVRPIPWLLAVGILASLAGGFLSWRAWRSEGHGSEPPVTDHTRRFLAGVGVAAGLLFALVILLQLLAALVFAGCEL